MRFLKILAYIFIVLISLVVFLSLVAKLNEDKITNAALKKIGESIEIPIRIGDVSFNLIRRFPSATVKLEDVWFGSPSLLDPSVPMDSSGNTLATIDKIFVSLKSKPLLKGEFDIRMVEIKGLDFNYIVNKHGISNFDFLFRSSSEPDTSKASLYLILKQFIARDIHCNYYDSLNHISAAIDIPRIEVSGEIKGEYLAGSAEGSVNLSQVNYKDFRLDRMKKMEIDFDADYFANTINIKKLGISSDGADFSISGNAVLMQDMIEADLEIFNGGLDISKLTSYLPAEKVRNMGIKRASGFVDINATINGYVSDTLIPEFNINAALRKGIFSYKDFPEFRNVSFHAYLTNGKQKSNASTIIRVQDFYAESNRSKVNMDISLSNLNKIRYELNTSIDANLDDFRQFIPDSIISSATGYLNASIESKGIIPDSVDMAFISSFLDNSSILLDCHDISIMKAPDFHIDSLYGNISIDNGRFVAQNFDAKLVSLGLDIRNSSFDARLNGGLINPDLTEVSLNSFRINTDKSVFYGNAWLKGLNQPDYRLSASFNVNLGDFSHIVHDTLVKHMSGEIQGQINSSGGLNPDSIKNQLPGIVFNNSSFLFSLKNINVELPDTLMRVKNMNGRMIIQEDTIRISGLNGFYNGIYFNMDSAKIAGLYKAIVLKQQDILYVDGRFALGDIDYTALAGLMAVKPQENAEKVNSEATTNNKISLPRYQLKGKLRIKSIRYKDALMENFSALFNVTDSLYLIDQFKFSGFGGRVNSSLRYSIKKNNERTLWVKNTIEGVDASRLLKDFDNFMDFYTPAITYENISGIMTTTIDGQILFRDDSLLRENMRVRADIKIERGGVYNYAPVQDMAQYLPGIDNLDVLEFKTINTSMFVFKDAIYVPSTLVISNKLDARALGMKSFGEDYSYHFEVFLSDILTGKSKRRIEKQDEIGEDIVTAGRKGTLVKSFSLDGKSKSGLDNEKDQAEMRKKVKVAEGLLNVRFHPKMVSYDTGIK